MDLMEGVKESIETLAMDEDDSTSQRVWQRQHHPEDPPSGHVTPSQTPAFWLGGQTATVTAIATTRWADSPTQSNISKHYITCHSHATSGIYYDTSHSHNTGSKHYFTSQRQHNSSKYYTTTQSRNNKHYSTNHSHSNPLSSRSPSSHANDHVMTTSQSRWATGGFGSRGERPAPTIPVLWVRWRESSRLFGSGGEHPAPTIATLAPGGKGKRSGPVANTWRRLC